MRWHEATGKEHLNMTAKLCRYLGLATLLVATGGCQNSLAARSLIFFTGTTLGVEASVSGADATGPVKIVIGYRRAEGVLNPVYHSNGVRTMLSDRDSYGNESEVAEQGATKLAEAPAVKKQAERPGENKPAKNTCGDDSIELTAAGGGNAPPQSEVKFVETRDGTIVNPHKSVSRYRDQAYSVLAKINADGSAEAATAKGEIGVGQIFATGLAAELLSQQPGVAAMLSGSAGVGEAAAKQAQAAFGQSLSAASFETTMTLAWNVHELARGEASNPSAQAVVGKLDAAAATLGIPETTTFYNVNDAFVEGANTRSVLIEAVIPAATKVTFQRAKMYDEKLSLSIDALKALEGKTIRLVDANGTATHVPTDPEIAPYKTIRVMQEKEQEKLRKAIKNNTDIAGAIKTFVNDVLLKPSTK